ncbi:MAG TPA: C25 family cysteine peptidase, partial [Thermoanaerobaculia bacterium]|nr:C25 family cysteine peptidase [Thermoanaerobaculia bacterium]
VKLTSRTALFDWTEKALSGNNIWKSHQLNQFTVPNDALDYGIWTLEASIKEYPTNQANYGTLYLGPDRVSQTPTGQPEPGAFRIYMATDAGTAPVKPYLEQQLRHGCGNQAVIPNGPNPPEQGEASCFTVTVRLVNPTAYPITFSVPTNVVTARVPGSEVTYFSEPGVETAVSQGTIVSEPTTGAGGDIVWNPNDGNGIVDAGTTALLTYHVVVEPNGPGSFVVTGTHDDGHGTRAQYVDETGNTTQARATSQLGPLCELSTSTVTPTPAVVTDLRVAPSPEGVLVSWETASEVGTASLTLERLERGTNRYVPVGEGPLHADPAAAAGSVYQLLDRGADPGAVEVYRVVERDVWGGVRVHGPFFARAADSPRLRRNENVSVAPRPLPVPARQLAVPLQVSTGRIIRPPVETPAPAGLKIGVAEAGLVQLRTGEIASGLGLPVAQVTARLASGDFALTRDGEPVAWTVADGNAGLLFFGEGVESPYSREAVYVLRPRAGVRMQATAAKVVPGETTSVLPSVASAEEDRLPVTVVASDPESDYWYWEVLQSGDPGSRHRSFSLDAPDARPDFGSATLRLGLQGASEGGHRVAVSLNGIALGEVEFAGLVPFVGELAVPPGIVRSGENRIDLEALPLPGGGANDLFADRFELVYPRRLAAYSDALELTAESTGPVSVDGFGWGEVVVLDLAAPLRPRLQQGTEVRLSGDGFRATFAAVAGRRYHVASRAGYRAPAWTQPLRDAGLLAPGRGADYLVITAEPLRSAAGELAALRAAEGLQTAVVTVEEIYDELAGGFPTPHAIRELLVEAAARWQPAPRYVVLAGSGHFDYRDLLGNGGNWVPPLLTGSRHGLFAADGRFADLTGDDWVPEVAIGRIPARTAAELSAYVAKLAAYEAGLGDASGRALLVADNAEPGLDFAAGLEELTESLPTDFEQGWVELVPGQVDSARAALFSGLASGANLLAYSGHGGIDRLAAEGLLTLADLPSLPAAGELPVMVALTCVLNRFELPYVEPLGARL